MISDLSPAFAFAGLSCLCSLLLKYFFLSGNTPRLTTACRVGECVMKKKGQAMKLVHPNHQPSVFSVLISTNSRGLAARLTDK